VAHNISATAITQSVSTIVPINLKLIYRDCGISQQPLLVPSTGLCSPGWE